jgi:hypothetical protein
MADLSSGIFALLGTGLGSLITWKIRSRDLKHEDHTRIHSQRLEIYTKFNGLANQVMSKFFIIEGCWDEDLALPFVTAYEAVRLVASSPVQRVAERVQHLTAAASGRKVTNLKEHDDSFNAEMKNLVIAMRKEVGTDRELIS